MISFVLSQLLGFIIFIVVNFSLFCYLAYKRNQAFKVDLPKKPLSYRFGFLFLFLFFVSGMSIRGYYATETYNELSTKRAQSLEEKNKTKVVENPS